MAHPTPGSGDNGDFILQFHGMVLLAEFRGGWLADSLPLTLGFASDPYSAATSAACSAIASARTSHFSNAVITHIK
jgi:hypothetical protein